MESTLGQVVTWMMMGYLLCLPDFLLVLTPWASTDVYLDINSGEQALQ